VVKISKIANSPSQIIQHRLELQNTTFSVLYLEASVILRYFKPIVIDIKHPPRRTSQTKEI